MAVVTKNTNDSANDTNEPEVTAQAKRGKKDPGLPPELADLVAELKETVKRIDPRKHTPRTLRRALSLAGDIIADIDRLTTTKP